MGANHILKVIVELDHDSGLPEDKMVNTFHFGGFDAAPTDAEMTAVDLLINDFYTVAASGSTGTVAGFLSSNLAGTWRWKMYDLHDATPRTPLRITIPAAFGPGGSAMPSEVTVCLSYEALPLSGVDQRNKRGRLFIGPLASTVLATATGRPVVSDNGIVDTLAAVGKRLADYGLTHPIYWVVYSPTTDLDNQVVRGWVDNAFDTQRKRGEKPTTRQLWAAA